jgi:hypothetical protein
VRGHIALATALIVACSAPQPATTPTDPSASLPPATALASQQPIATTPPSSPISAGAVSDAGILFFFDYSSPDAGQTVSLGLYRYDGTSGALSKITAGLFGGSITHESASGIYVQGPNGRWDLLRWDGSRASDQDFTACQQEPGLFASWCSASATGVGVGYGSHTGPGPGPLAGPWCPTAFVRLPGTARSTSFPPELCVQAAKVSADGKQILISDVARQSSPEALFRGRCQSGYVTFDETACYEQRLWMMPVGGTPRRLRLSPGVPGLVPWELSPDGRFATGQVDGGLFFVDLQTGTVTPLGTVRRSALRWSSNDGLAFVRGAAEDLWIDRTVVVMAAGGPAREVRLSQSARAIGIAPAWDPGGRRLAWIASAAGIAGASDAAQDYLDGKGVGDRRVLVGDLISDPVEIRCGEGVAEGVRWSQSGTMLLLLCRRPGARVAPFDLWLHRLGAPGGASVALVRGITWGGVDPHGFAPDLFTQTAWSRALATISP